MARPFKQGLDYFPLDVDIFDDAKIEELNFKYGYLGEIIYIRLLTIIYRNGYYIEKTVPAVTKQLIRFIGSSVFDKEKIIEEIILFLGELNLLEKSLLYKGVLTSKSIQRQFILSTKRRKRIDVKSYWLLSKEEMKEFNFINNNNGIQVVSNNLDNDNNNEVNDNNNDINASNNNDTVNDKYTKERKVKKSNDKKINDKGTFQVPSASFLTNSLIKNKYIESDSLEILKYNKLFDEAVDAFNFEDVLSVVDYLMKYSKKEGIVIENKYAFFKESLYRNLEMLDKGVSKNGKIEDIIKQLIL